MALGDRRLNRMKRNSTRNASCGLDGNEPSSKPRLKSNLVDGPRKPNLKVPNPVPKKKNPKDPSKIKDAKPKPMSFDKKRERAQLTCGALKSLDEFNLVVNSLAVAGMEMIDMAGGFSVVEELQYFVCDAEKAKRAEIGDVRTWRDGRKMILTMSGGKRVWKPFKHQRSGSIMAHELKHAMAPARWAAQNLKAAGGAKVIRLRADDGREAIIHPSAKWKGKTQLTFVTNGKPSGDAKFDSNEQALRSVSGELVHDKPHARPGEFYVVETRKEWEAPYEY